MTPSKILTWDPMVNECGNIIDVADLRAQHLNEFVLCVWTDLSLHLASAMCMAASTRPLGLFAGCCLSFREMEPMMSTMMDSPHGLDLLGNCWHACTSRCMKMDKRRRVK